MATAEVDVTTIAAGGAGVARLPDGRAVFVQRTAPGDRALIEITREKKRWAAGRLLRLLEPGAGRREAPCPHYRRCGGCTLEHLDYARQLDIKADIVRETLKRIGRIEIERPIVNASPNEFRYRNRVSFTLVRSTTGDVRAGFHDLDRPDRIIDISADCLMPELPIADAWARLRASWGPGANLLPSGPELRLTLRANAREQVGLVIDGGYSSGQPQRLLELVPEIRSIWHRTQGAAAHVHLAGTETFTEVWQEEDITLSGAMFLQVNRAVAQLLEQHVIELATREKVHTVVDAYCGVGFHARRLARIGARVVGIELDSAAVAEAQRAEAPSATFVAARVEDVIASYLPADLVVANPPRAGMDEGVVAALNAKPPRRIIYVSCDPATLARDLERLSAKFKLESIACFDLFPQTTHVETVVELCAIS